MLGQVNTKKSVIGICLLALVICLAQILVFHDVIWKTNNSVDDINRNLLISQQNKEQEEYIWCQNILKNYSNSFKQYLYETQNWDTSQHSQDWFLYSSMIRNMENKGFYVDLAANDYKWLSNTYFLDKCLSWNGICIEADRSFWYDLHTERSCHVIQNCIWDKKMNMTFITKGDRTGKNGLKGYNKLRDKGREIPMTCTTLNDVLNDRNITHIDFLSLDIEGAELHALLSIDFTKIQIDVIDVEINVKGIKKFMESKGFILKKKVKEDGIFVHQNAIDKLRWIDKYLKESKKYFDGKVVKS